MELRPAAPRDFGCVDAWEGGDYKAEPHGRQVPIEDAKTDCHENDRSREPAHYAEILGRGVHRLPTINPDPRRGPRHLLALGEAAHLTTSYTFTKYRAS